MKVFHMHLSTMIIGPHLCYRNYPGSVSSAVTRVCYFRSCSALSTSHGIIGCKEAILALVDQFISTNIVNNMCIVKNSIYVLNIHTNDQNLSCDSIASLFTASRHFPIYIQRTFSSIRAIGHVAWKSQKATQGMGSSSQEQMIIRRMLMLNQHLLQ